MRKALLFGFLSWLLASSVFAQDAGLLTERIKKLMNEYPRLTVTVFFSQDRFIPGDSALVYAEVRDPSGQIFTRRQVLHLELVNEEGKIVHRQHALLPSGKADTFISFPTSLKPGNYLLRSYTDYMRNFGTASYFYREIELLADRSLRQATIPPSLIIYSEGGKLLGGFPARIILSHHGVPLGSAIEVHGSISGSLGKIFADGSGFSEFRTKPVPGEQISASYGDRIKSNALAAQSEGVSLVMHRGEKPRMVVYRRGAAYRNEKKLSAVVFTGGKLLLASVENASADSLVYALSGDFTIGTSRFSLFDSEGTELLSRIFLSGTQMEAPKVTSDKPVYAMREAITLQSEVFEFPSAGNRFRPWISVTDSRAWRKPEQMVDPVLHSTFLASGFGLQHPDYRHGQHDDRWLSVVQENWLPLNWQKPDVKAVPFSSVLRFDGTVFRNGERLLTDSLSLMLFLQNKMIGYEVPVHQGRFEFPLLFDFMGEDDLFYSVYRNDSVFADAKMYLDRDTVSQVIPSRTEMQYNKDFFADQLLRKRATEKSFRFFAGSSAMLQEEALDPNKPFENKLRGVDVSVRIEDYVVFPTMEDVIREIIPSLRFRRTPSGPMVRVVLYSPVVLNDPIISRGDPLYIIDGKMTRDSQYFLSLNPADLITIGVVRNISKLTPIGAIGRNGVVIIRTRRPLAIQEFTDNTFMKISGLNPKPLKSQNSHENPRVPDLRFVLSTLSPAHPADNATPLHSFKASDQVGSFLIRLEGYSDTGAYFSGWSKFSVSQP